MGKLEDWIPMYIAILCTSPQPPSPQLQQQQQHFYFNSGRYEKMLSVHSFLYMLLALDAFTHGLPSWRGRMGERLGCVRSSLLLSGSWDRMWYNSPALRSNMLDVQGSSLPEFNQLRKTYLTTAVKVQTTV